MSDRMTDKVLTTKENIVRNYWYSKNRNRASPATTDLKQKVKIEL